MWESPNSLRFPPAKEPVLLPRVPCYLKPLGWSFLFSLMRMLPVPFNLPGSYCSSFGLNSQGICLILQDFSISFFFFPASGRWLALSFPPPAKNITFMSIYLCLSYPFTLFPTLSTFHYILNPQLDCKLLEAKAASHLSLWLQCLAIFLTRNEVSKRTC